MAVPKTSEVQPWPVVEAFRSALREQFGERLKGLILYGSLARGEWTPGSDIDVVVLLDDALDSAVERKRVWRTAWDLMERCGVMVEPLVFTETAFQRGHAPIFFNIRREGWFIMPDKEPTAVEELLGKARKALEDARRLLEVDSANGTTSRAYYVMFGAAQAALLSRGITRSRHTGVHSTFNYYFVRTGQLPSILYDAVVDAYNKRIIVDYSPQSVTLEEARNILRDAEAFLQAIEELLARETQP